METRAAANLALAEGKCRCRYCKRAGNLHEYVVVFWQGNIMFACCPSCLPKYPLVLKRIMRHGSEHFYIGPLRSEDRPSDIVVVRDMRDVKPLAKVLLPKKRKLDMDTE